MVTFSDKSLEDLAIAIQNLRNSKDLRVAVSIKDILQPWVVAQYPDLIQNPDKIFELMKQCSN